MSKITKTYETRLETSNCNEVVAILDAKLQATSANSVTDYVSLAVDNLDSQVERMKLAKKDLDMLIKIAEVQKDIIKVGTALWLTESGIDSLNGDIVSSMKITTPKTKETLKVTNEESLINQGYFKQVIDKTAVKQAILDGVSVDGAEIEVEHQGDTLSIYKKRGV